ncbi:MIP/aquaporin family protein [Streptomyces sp. H10-C2]|uniref:MIP/aquaporin family protein n=1 Tax=unclassified Streptomyces TaxID=2593676 RepID=UPI0024BA0DE3|nr:MULTISPECIES: MIP/aquaporin family protein [unclassified Streptomyces]MDJ0343392.1 MIP/aquaporin family protein [Streptomyces sp. PH10-H1]MDJ0371797.1 MIP/aquaporin family protein [Streptomyces sp. H10-C2]
MTDTTAAPRIRNPLASHRLLGEMLAEFTGTMMLILLGVGVVAQVVAAGVGGHDSIAWAWGLGVTFGVYIAARTSGAHLNPAVTVALATYRGFPWRKVAPYAVAQTAGAFTAALLVRWNYTEVLAAKDPGHTIKTQGVFSTLPGNGTFPVSEWGALRDQVIGTAILLLIIMALTDILNTAPKANLGALLVGLSVVGIGMAFGTDAGYAINPARDFGPRLASFITGYGGAWRDQYGELYFWVPIVGPLVGGLIGATLYRFLISPFLLPEEPPLPGRVLEDD